LDQTHYLVGNLMSKPRVPGSTATGIQSMPSTQLVNGRLVSQLLQTEVFEELQHLDYIPNIHKLLDNIARYKAAENPDSVPEGVDS
jgi:hypothetical protein